MAKKTSAERRPVKARGTIPAPRVSPERRTVSIHKRRPVQITAAVIVAGLLGLGTWQFLGARSETKAAEREFKAFERGIQALQSTASAGISGMASLPDQLLQGAIKLPAFKKEAAKWPGQMSKFYDGVTAEVVTGELEDTRAVFLQAAAVYLDAAKAFQSAAGVPDSNLRRKLIENGRNLRTHADSILQSALRLLERRKVGLGLVDAAKSSVLQQRAPLAPKEAPAPAPPGPPIAPPGQLPPPSQPLPVG